MVALGIDKNSNIEGEHEHHHHHHKSHHHDKKDGHHHQHHHHHSSSKKAEITKMVRKGDDSEYEEEGDEEMKIHKNSFDSSARFGTQSLQDDETHKTLAYDALDLKSKTVADKGDFKHFNLPQTLVEKLKAKNITFLYPIQVATLEHIRAGHDVIAQARTGTGKTLAFGIPIVELLEKQGSSRQRKPAAPSVLVLEPTRELAKQVADDFQGICSESMTTCCVYGGVAYERQRAQFARGVDIMAATPGRVIDFLESQSLDLSHVKIVVLDEVDRMLDMGFQDSVEQILKSIYTEERRGANKAQTLFFSATCPPWVKRTAKKYISDDFKFIDLIGDSKLKTATTVEHYALQCSYQDRAATIGSVLQVYSGKHGRAMIFCETKRDADELACSSEIKAESHVLHGDVPQDKREMVLQKFRAGRYRVLITTDVAARGLDIPEVDLVICCNPPKDYESYVHRSGRTGRAGRAGVCVCFYKSQETWALNALERNAGVKFKRIGAPSSAEIVESSINDAVKALDIVTDDLIERFRHGAENVLKTKDAVTALAAALAVISGCTKVTNRSLLSSREGLTTYILSKSDEEIRGKSFVYVIMKKMLGEEQGEQAVNKVCFTKDKKSLVFDVPSEYDSVIEEKWFNTRSLEMKKVTDRKSVV